VKGALKNGLQNPMYLVRKKYKKIIPTVTVASLLMEEKKIQQDRFIHYLIKLNSFELNHRKI
jgi:DNA polymerase elongation subunit (family B)